jgi:hypothetical protein
MVAAIELLPQGTVNDTPTFHQLEGHFSFPLLL